MYRTKNPAQPEGLATEKVVTYYRKPAYAKGREWLERELGQQRLFEYNPAKLSVQSIGNGKYGFFVNSQLLRQFSEKGKANNYLKALKERASKISLKNNPLPIAAPLELEVEELQHLLANGVYLQITDVGDENTYFLGLDGKAYFVKNYPAQSVQDHFYKQNPGQYLVFGTDKNGVRKSVYANDRNDAKETAQMFIKLGYKNVRIGLANPGQDQAFNAVKSQIFAVAQKLERYARTYPFEHALQVVAHEENIKPEALRQIYVTYRRNKNKKPGRMARRNPGDDLGDLAADGARAALDAFDYNNDNDLDYLDIQDFEEYEPLPAQVVYGLDTEQDGEILQVTPDGDLVIEWQDGGITTESAEDLLTGNGVKDWYIRQRAGREYKKSLKYQQKAQRSRAKQAGFESDLKDNPFLDMFANLAVGTAAALEVKDRVMKKEKPAETSRVTKRNPSFAQLVQKAGKDGKDKVGVPKGAIEKVKQYRSTNGGRLKKFGLRWFYMLPKNLINKQPKNTKKNPPANHKKTGKTKSNPATSVKKNEAFEAFQGRPATEELQLITPANAPKRLYTLGKLLEIKVKGIGQPFDFRRETTGKTYYLCADNRNKQMWIAGAKFATKGEPENLGAMDYVIYETQKIHLGDDHGESRYIHFLGEEGGARPTLEVDSDGFAHIIGGDYTITPLGIKD